MASIAEAWPELATEESLSIAGGSQIPQGLAGRVRSLGFHPCNVNMFDFQDRVVTCKSSLCLKQSLPLLCGLSTLGVRVGKKVRVGKGGSRKMH